MKKLLFAFLSFYASLTLQAQQPVLSCSKANLHKHTPARTEAVYPVDSPLLHVYDVHYYKLDIEVQSAYKSVSGQVTIGATVLDGPLTHFAFQLDGLMSISSITINGVASTWTWSNGVADVTIDTPIPQGGNVTAVISYAGNPGGGMFNGKEPFGNENLTWTLSEPYSSFYWFPVKQVLHDKADSVDVWVTTDLANKVGSNGLLKNITPISSTLHRYEWKSTYPIAYYLISVAVAHYVEYTIYAHPTSAPQPIPVVNYIYAHPDALTTYKTEIDKTTDMLEEFSEKLGLYPFHLEKYGHCTAPIGGGMEHQTMTTQSDFVTFLTAHELGHQWFGDMVTCASWRDIWLNEGLASYTEYMYNQRVGTTAARDWLDITHNTALQSNGSVWVDDTSLVERIFSPELTYKKGAMLVHMLRNEIHNDALFYSAIRQYLQTYKNKTATTDDFQHSIENSTGLVLDTFFDQWFRGSGYPIYKVTWNHIPGGNFYLKNEQTGSNAAVTPHFNNTVEYYLTRSGAPDTVLRVALDQPVNEFSFSSVQGTVLKVTVDSSQWILNKVNSVINDPALVTSIDNQEQVQEVRLFPNPARETISLKVPSTYKDKVLLLNSSGQHLKTIELNDNQSSIELKGLPAGLYLLLMQDGKQQLRFVKE